MHARSPDLLATSGLALGAATLLALAGDLTLLRLLASLPLLFVLPGYALTAACFPRHEFGWAERAASALALSLISAILGGLLLNLTPWGLQASSWVGLTLALTLGGCAVAAWRRRGYERAQDWPAIGLRAEQLVVLALAGILVGWAVTMAVSEGQRTPAPDYVHLWVLPDPTRPSQAMQVGITGRGEDVPAAFRLQLKRGNYLLREWDRVGLDASGAWQTTVELRDLQAGSGALEALLYRIDAPDTVYRRVAHWPSAMP